VKKTKYILNNGLAFSEEKDLKKLSELAEEGWILEDFAFGGLFFKLKKAEPQNIIYNLDYQTNVNDDYFDFFSSAGWTLVCSKENSMFIFSAPEGTKPIYSDKTTLLDKYEGLKAQMFKVALPSFFTTFLLFILLSLLTEFNKVLENIILIAALLSLIVFIFSVMPYVAFLFKIKKLRKG
jgi:hypothetical protein